VYIPRQIDQIVNACMFQKKKSDACKQH